MSATTLQGTSYTYLKCKGCGQFSFTKDSSGVGGKFTYPAADGLRFPMSVQIKELGWQGTFSTRKGMEITHIITHDASITLNKDGAFKVIFSELGEDPKIKETNHDCPASKPPLTRTENRERLLKLFQAGQREFSDENRDDLDAAYLAFIRSSAVSEAVEVEQANPVKIGTCVYCPDCKENSFTADPANSEDEIIARKNEQIMKVTIDPKQGSTFWIQIRLDQGISLEHRDDITLVKDPGIYELQTVLDNDGIAKPKLIRMGTHSCKSTILGTCIFDPKSGSSFFSYEAKGARAVDSREINSVHTTTIKCADGTTVLIQVDPIQGIFLNEKLSTSIPGTYKVRIAQDQDGIKKPILELTS